MTTEAELNEAGYPLVRILPNGEWIGLKEQMYTTGLFVGLDRDGYRCRYCYEKPEAAVLDFICWNGEGDPIGKWIKHKGKDVDGKPVDRLNPRLRDEVF